MISQLPNESIIYFGDTARVPYGPKSPDTVVRYSREITSYLKGEGVKALVIACNTATAHALPALRREFDLPIVGVIQPGARAAASATKTKRVGVIGTAGTIKSGAYEKEIRRILPDATITARACALFVPLVIANPSRFTRESRDVRWLAVTLIAFLSLANITSLGGRALLVGLRAQTEEPRG